MYPLKFENIYYEKVWGGYDFKKFRKNAPDGKIGESWDIACHPNGTSIVKNGKYKGLSLENLIKREGDKLLGKEIPKDNFPLLLKILNTSDRLSIQVHPDDKYAYIHEGEMGKTEAWYIVDAKEGATIILGTENCSKEEFVESIKNNNMEKYMKEIPVEKGQVYYLKSGLIHGMGAGILAVEIQQNSNTTYRLYDYNRGRALHIAKALEVMDFTIEPKESLGLKIEGKDFDKTFYCLNEHFALELYKVKKNLRGESDQDRFCIYTVVEGKGSILYGENEKIKLNMGDSILIPATMGKYKIEGRLKLLKSYVPSIEKVEREILKTIK